MLLYEMHVTLRAEASVIREGVVALVDVNICWGRQTVRLVLHVHLYAGNHSGRTAWEKVISSLSHPKVA